VHERDLERREFSRVPGPGNNRRRLCRPSDRLRRAKNRQETERGAMYVHAYFPAATLSRTPATTERGVPGYPSTLS